MEFVSLSLGEALRDYQQVWDLQREVHAEVVAGTRANTVLLVEHSSVYTAGKRTAKWDRPTDDTPVIDVDRGGKITWHGPGQLVAYPIIRLPEPTDVIRYVRALEQSVIDTAKEFGISAQRVEGRSGVWLTAANISRHHTAKHAVSTPAMDRKLAAIGVRVARGVTMHGLALNCNPDLGAFDKIVPCGISDAGVTSLSVEYGSEITITQALAPLKEHLSTALAYAGEEFVADRTSVLAVEPVGAREV